MFIGIGQGRALGGDDAQMGTFSLATGEAARNLPKRMGAAQPAEGYGDELALRSKTVRVTLGCGLFEPFLKFDGWE